MAIVYSVREWARHFEVAQSRKLTKSMTWVPTPCKHDGKSFRRIMLMPDGAAIYGAWMLIVQIAAKSPVRGVLADTDGPLDASDLAVKTGCPESVFERALSVLCSNKIGWIVGEQWESSGSSLPPKTGQDRTGQDKDSLWLESHGDGESDESTEAIQSEPTADANGDDGAAGDTADDGPAMSYPDAFEEFWLAYPMRDGRRRGKRKAYGLWQGVRSKDRPSVTRAAMSYAKSDEATRGFVRDAERFLKSDWWRDWLTPAEKATAASRVFTAEDYAREGYDGDSGA